MNGLQFVLHASVILLHIHHQPANAQRIGKCEHFVHGEINYFLQCEDANREDIRKEFESIIDGPKKNGELKFTKLDLSEFYVPEQYLHNVVKIELNEVHMGHALSEFVSNFPKLELLLMNNMHDKVMLERETFIPGQPILTLIFNNNGLKDGDIDIDAFENIKDSLKSIELRDNQLTYLPTAIKDLPNLVDLDFAGNPIKYFSEEHTQQLRTLRSLKLMKIDDLDCQCHLLREGFPKIIKEMMIDGVKCSHQSPEFPGEQMRLIDVDKTCGVLSNPTPTPNGNSQIKVTLLVLFVTILPWFLK